MGFGTTNIVRWVFFRTANLPGSECCPRLSPSNTRFQSTWEGHVSWVTFVKYPIHLHIYFCLLRLIFQVKLYTIWHWPHVRYLIYWEMRPPGLIDLILKRKVSNEEIKGFLLWEIPPLPILFWRRSKQPGSRQFLSPALAQNKLLPPGHQ